ncbi:MAG: type III secretion system chaperone [Kiritimatiellae bacterium]|nr:type III secretion system chaperone [Kiritimatiellia bacterium]
MDNLGQALKELGAKIGFDIALDENGTCTLELDDGRPFVLQERPELDELDFVATLGGVPEEDRAEVFADLLAANFYWRQTLGATLSWNVELEQVALIYPFPLADATSETLEAVFSRFLELQAFWKERLAALVDGIPQEEDAGGILPEDGGDAIIKP